MEQCKLRVLNYKIDPLLVLISLVYTDKLRVKISSKSRTNFEICNILAASKDWENL